MKQQQGAGNALSSADGKTWSPQSLEALRDGDAPVTRIVIGALGDDETVEASAALLAAVEEHRTTLTHLHLWGIANLTGLPALPDPLQCLDLRNCAALTELPALPEQLQTLDLGGCRELRRLPAPAPPALERLHLDDCPALPARHVEFFLESLHAGCLREFDASRHPGLASLETLPASLRRLALAGCAALRDASRISALETLEHLDLRDCAALEELPDVPAALRHLVLHGCDRLARFRGQSVGALDRGADKGDNVAALFQARRRFGDRLAVSAHAKLLLLGDGRVGKSTLAKRLLWESLPPAEQADEANAWRRPTQYEDPTHKMHFWRWQAPLDLAADKREELDGRARERELELPLDAEGRLQGAVRLWDFGGQEIYHNTHRLFAAEGAVFLLVWREEGASEEELKASCPDDCTLAQWIEWNRQRLLDYWLEYIVSMRPDAHVALVCTNCPPGQPRPDWQPRAPRYASTAPGAAPECFYLDSLDEDCAGSPDFRRLLAWLAPRLGAEAERIGLLQPAFFVEIADRVDEMLKENDGARRRNQRGQYLLLD